MDDRHSQFLILVAEICSCAIAAELDVRLQMEDGARLRGVPTGTVATTGEDELDDTGYANSIHIDDVEVRLDEIVECTVYQP